MSDSEIIRDCLIQVIEHLKAHQEALNGVLNKLAGWEDIIRATQPGVASALGGHIGGMYQELSAPFDEDGTIRPLDDLIQKLKGLDAQA